MRGEPVNVFASWSGDESAEGFFLELPAGWGLDSATVLRKGYYRVPAHSRRIDGLRYLIDVSETLDDPHELVLHVRPGDAYAQDRIALTPVSRSGDEFAPRTALRVERRLRIVDRVPLQTNRVLSFTGTAPVELHPRSTPDLGLDRSFEVSFWMKSTALGEVVLSTWNGDDRRPYPLEMVIDAAGHLRAFRGKPGEHQSLVSRRPVADGSWHLVSFSNHPEAGWTRLVLDGRDVDSLYAASSPDIGMELPFVLGGRAVGLAAYFDGLKPFSGSLDELRIDPQEGRGLHFGFEEDNLEDDNFEAGNFEAGKFEAEVERDFERAVEAGGTPRRTSGVAYEWSDLYPGDEVETFQALTHAGGVTLTWTASTPRSRVFVVERSRDGRVFEEIARVEPNRGGTYSVRDNRPGDGVVVYRLRRPSPDADEQVSGMLRVGLGGDDVAPVALLGNFPNPFNTTTTISYQVREAARIQLAVWDLSGQSVSTLVDQTQRPGVYESRFDAGDLPSGTYFVRLQSPQGTASHKMILTK